MRFLLGCFFLFLFVSFSSSAEARGMSFDGTNDYYETDLGNMWAPSAWTVETTFTIRDWNTKTYDHLFSLGFGHNVTMYVHSGLRTLSFKGYFNGVRKEYKMADLVTNQEYHVAAVFTGNDAFLYVNNQLVRTFTADNPTTQTTTLLRVGGTTNAVEMFKGEISEFAIWNKALTQSEIYDTPKTGTELSLLAWYQFTPLETGKAYDLSTHSYDLTGFNFPNNSLAFRSSTVQPNAITWNWNKSAYATSYELKQNGSSVYSGTHLSFTDSGLSAGTPYTYDFIATSPTGESKKVTLTQNSGPQSFLSFNGNNQYLSIPKNVFTYPMTIEMWVKPADPVAAQHYIYGGVGLGDGWGTENECHIGQTDGNYAVFCRTNNTYHISMFPAPVDTQWHHLAVVFDTTTSFYLDGVLKTAATTNATPDFSSFLPYTLVGKPTVNTRFFKGSMSELRIWNTARTQTQIQSMRFQPMSGTEIGLMGYYPLNGLYRGQALDKTPFANHAAAFRFMLDSQTIRIQLASGTFGFTTPTLTTPFSTVTLTGSKQLTTATLDGMTLVDARGSDDGWTLQVSATPFQEIGGQGYRLAASSLTLSPPSSLLPVGGTDSVLPATGYPSEVVLDSGFSVPYLIAQPGEGMGTFSLTFPANSLKLSILPASTFVDKVSYPSSSTPYVSTLSWTLITGP